MEITREPDKLIEIDLPKVAKNGLWLTVLAWIVLMIGLVVLKGGIAFTFTIWTLLGFIIGYIVLIVLHEFFHLLGFWLFGKVPWKSMIVGVNLKMGIAYATTDKLMTNKAIRKALLLPFWTTGVVPALFGLFLENGMLIGLAALLIGGAAGDFEMYKELKKLPDDWVVRDDPKMPRLYVYKPERVDW